MELFLYRPLVRTSCYVIFTSLIIICTCIWHSIVTGLRVAIISCPFISLLRRYWLEVGRGCKPCDRSGSHYWDTLGESLPFPPASSVQQDNSTHCSWPPRNIAEFLCNPHGKTICRHRWEGGTSACSSNCINRDIPEIIELCMVGIKLMLQKCQLFRSEFSPVWSMEHLIKIIQSSLLKLQI